MVFIVNAVLYMKENDIRNAGGGKIVLIRLRPTKNERHICADKSLRLFH